MQKDKFIFHNPHLHEPWGPSHVSISQRCLICRCNKLFICPLRLQSAQTDEKESERCREGRTGICFLLAGPRGKGTAVLPSGGWFGGLEG